MEVGAAGRHHGRSDRAADLPRRALGSAVRGTDRRHRAGPAVVRARRGCPRKAGIAAQGVLGVYIGTMVHRDALTALGSDWPIVLARRRRARWC